MSRAQRETTSHEPAWGTRALERRTVTARPYPPDDCDEDRPECFRPDARFAEWIRDTFLAATGPLANEEHEHLLDATIGVLWTNAVNQSKQRLILATAEVPNAMTGGWRRARFDFQLREWFDVEPSFLLTFSAPDCARLDDRGFCALVEHELYHCAQKLDRYGEPAFNRETGLPEYALKGHDVEEFVGVVRRYGPTSSEVRALVDAAQRPPLIAGEPIAIACGVCLERAA